MIERSRQQIFEMQEYLKSAAQLLEINNTYPKELSTVMQLLSVVAEIRVAKDENESPGGDLST